MVTKTAKRTVKEKVLTSETLNQIFLRRKLKVVISTNQDNIDSSQYVATILKNIEPLGFIFSKELMDILNTKPVSFLEQFYLEIIPVLKKMVGAHVKHTPMYPNFPKQVMDMHECELYFNAILHYLGFGLPEYEKEERLPLFEKTTPRIIELSDINTYHKMFCNLMQSKTSISETDKEDLTNWVVNSGLVVNDYLPETFGTKENMSFVIGLLLRNNFKAHDLEKCFKTATDVLRLAVSLSDGDTSLSDNTKFKSFTRKERKLILDLLDRVKTPLEDMDRYRSQWIRLGERLHPGEYEAAFNKAVLAFKKIRSKDKIETFNSRVEASILNRDISSALYLLKQRPGELARRLDKLLRIKLDNKNEMYSICLAFEEVASKINSTVLLQVIAHFNNRNRTDKDLRTFFPKGNVAKVQAISNTLPYLPKDICNRIVAICENSLIQQYKTKCELGKVYIDPALKGYLVPFSQRSASKALRTIVRGSRVKMPDNDVVRFFLWWKNGDSRVDIDLSAVLYDTNWDFISQCTYYNLKDYGMVHSGDITNAPKGASEFIDIDTTEVPSNVRYILMCLNSFTSQPFCDLPECFAGWMGRNSLSKQEGEIYEPKTVKDKVDLSSNTKVCIPVIFDLKEKEIIWADLGLTDITNWYGNNVNSNKRNIVTMAKAITQLNKTNLYDLFSLHIKARGEFTNVKEEADVIFSVTEGITPYDVETIMSDYL